MLISWSLTAQDADSGMSEIEQESPIIPNVALDSLSRLDKLSLPGLDSVNLQFNAVKNVSQKVYSVAKMPTTYMAKIDSLLQAKSNLIQQKINQLQAGALEKLPVNKLDSLKQLSPELTQKLYPNTGQMQEIDGLLKEYTSKIGDAEELAWMEHYGGQLNQLQSVVDQYQNKVLNLEELQALKGYQQQLHQLTESQGYLSEAQEMLVSGLQENSPLMQTLESKIGMSKEFQELQKQTAALEKVKNMPADYQKDYDQYQDKEYARQKAIEQAKKLATNNFVQHKDKLETAQKKLTDFKKKYSSLQSTKDLSTAVKRNSLKGKPFSERLVLGGTLQVNRDPTSLDISPILGYRLDKKFTLGIGGTYRAVLDIDDFQTEDQVYGFRSFMEMTVYKGFFLHGEYERLNVALDIIAPNDEVQRKWTNNGLVGIGREYKLFKGVKGQVMVLYNLTYEEGVTPYEKPWVLRFGFVL